MPELSEHSAALRLQQQGKERASKRAQTALRDMSCAPLGQRGCAQTVSRRENRCQTYVRIGVLSLSDASLPQHQAPRGHRRGRGRIRRRAQRPDRRNRRRQVDPRRSRRPAARRPRLGDLVRTGEDAATIEAIFESGGEELLVRREITAQGRSRAFINGELATAGALKDLVRAARSSCTASTSIRRCSIRPRISPSSTPSAASTPLVERRRARRSRRMRGVASELDALRRRLRRARRAPGAGRRSSWRARAGGARSRARTRSSTAHAPGAGERRARRAALRGELRGALRERRRGPGRARRRLAAGRRAGGARPAVPAVPRRARRHQVAARGSRALPPALRRRHRRVAGAAAAGRGAAGAARAAEAQVRADARRRRSRGATRCARELADLEHGDERLAELERAHAAARDAYLRGRGGAVGGAARRPRATFARAARSGCSPSWRWSGRGSRSASTPSRCRRRRGRAQRHRRGRVLRVAESRARISGRWRASCRAASCRASCWRSRR